MTNLTVLLMHCIFRVSSDVSCIICSFYFGWWENKLTSASWELWPLFSLLFSSLSPPPTTSGKLINHSYKYPRSTKPNIKVDPSTHFRSFLYFTSGIYSSVLCLQITVTLCVCLCVLAHSQLLNHVRLFETPWAVTYQAPLTMGFSRQEYSSGLLFPSPGDLPNPGIKPAFSTLAGGFFTAELPGKHGSVLFKALLIVMCHCSLE